MKKILILIAVLFVFSFSGSGSVILKAYELIPNPYGYDWCYQWDFTVSDGGWQNYTTFEGGFSWYNNSGVWESGLGWRGSNTRGNDTEYFWIYLDLPFATTFKRFEHWVDHSGGTYVAGSDNISARFHTGGGEYSHSYTNTDISTAGGYKNQGLPSDGTNTGYSGIVRLSLQHFLAEAPETAYREKYIVYGDFPNPFPENHCVPDTPEWVRPLFDTYEDTDIINNDLNSNVSSLQYSIVRNAYVHAAFDGVITYIRPASNDDCDYLLGETVYWFYAPPDNLGHCHFSHPIDDDYVFLGVDTDDVESYIVTLQSDEYTLEYFLNEPVSGLDIGDSVTAGCVLGGAVDVRTAFDGLAEKGLIAISAFDSEGQLNANDYFSIEPESDAPFCADTFEKPFDDSSCINTDAYLQEPDAWLSFNGGFWERLGGFYLEGGTSLRQIMNLSDLENYQVAVGFYNYSGFASELQITLGSATSTEEIEASSSQQLVVLDAPLPLPDIEGFYGLAVENLGDYAIFVNFICIKLSDSGDFLPTPKFCYLENFTFDTDENWIFDGGQYYYTRGEIRLQTDATATQNIALPEGDYEITLEVGIYKTGSYAYAGESGGVNVEFGFNGVDYVLSSDIGADTYADFDLFNATKLTGALSVISDTTSDFSISFTLDSPAPAGVVGIVVRSACIRKLDTGGGGGSGDIFDIDCGLVSAPQDDSVPSWIEWQWNQQNKFFRCELMILLNRIYNLIYTAYKTFAWTARYWIIFAQEAVDWFDNQFVGWLDGHFANLTASGLDGGGGSCDNLWCFLNDLFTGVIEQILSPILSSILGWLDLVLTWLLDIVTLILGFIFSLLALLVTNVLFGFQVFAALIAAYNSAVPTPITGLPDCTVTSPNDNFWCAGLWTLENTIWARSNHVFTAISAGEILNSMIIGIGTINLAVWVIAKTRAIFLDGAKSV